MIAPNHHVLTGLDVWSRTNSRAQGEEDRADHHHTGLDQNGRRNVDAMREAGVQVTALFSPEHGIAGKEDRPDMADDKDAATGLPVWSLHYNGVTG